MRKSKDQLMNDREYIDICDDLLGPVGIMDTGRGIYITQDGKCLIGAKIGLVDDSEMDDDFEWGSLGAFLTYISMNLRQF